MNLNPLRHIVKEIAACAVLELFPGTQLLGGSVDEIGFDYTFQFPSEILTTFSERELSHIEERMIQIIHERRPIKTLEMMSENAATFLEHLGQFARAEAAFEEECNIISLVEIGSFRDICPGPNPEDTGEVKAFKLQGFTEEESGVVRIFGTAFPDRQALKTFLKSYKAAVKRDPEVIGPKEGYFIPKDGERIYLAKGVHLLDKLRQFWEEAYKDFEQITFPDSLEPKQVHVSLAGVRKSASLSFHRRDWATIKCADAAELEHARISSLQFMEKAFKIFPFDRRIRTIERKEPVESILFRAQDGYGREKTLSYIEVERKKNVLHRSLFYSPRAWVALIIEMGVEI